jgi:hypothetical protein
LEIGVVEDSADVGKTPNKDGGLTNKVKVDEIAIAGVEGREIA